MKRSESAADHEPFGAVFERKFRQHVLIIALSLIIGGFAAGFAAYAALSEARKPEPLLLCVPATPIGSDS